MSVDLPEFSVRVAPGEIKQLVVVNGELDLVTAPQLEERLRCVIDSTDGDVVVDLANVTFIDSTGLSAMLVAHDRLCHTNRVLAIRRPSVQVVRLLEICGLCNLLEADPSDGDGSRPQAALTADVLAGDGDLADGDGRLSRARDQGARRAGSWKNVTPAVLAPFAAVTVWASFNYRDRSSTQPASRMSATTQRRPLDPRRVDSHPPNLL